MQVAITVPDDELDELDQLVPGEFRSRAEAVRAAVRLLLRERRRAAIDEQYRQAYAALPQSVDDLEAGSGGPDEPHAWDDLEW